MNIEKKFDKRMKRRDTLIASTSKKFIDLYRDNIEELYNLHKSGVDLGYIDEFLEEIKKEIIKQLS